MVPSDTRPLEGTAVRAKQKGDNRFLCCPRGLYPPPGTSPNLHHSIRVRLVQVGQQHASRRNGNQSGRSHVVEADHAIFDYDADRAPADLLRWEFPSCGWVQERWLRQTYCCHEGSLKPRCSLVPCRPDPPLEAASCPSPCRTGRFVLTGNKAGCFSSLGRIR